MASGSSRGRVVVLLAVVIVLMGLPALAQSAGPDGPSAQSFAGGLGVIAHTTGAFGNLDISRIDVDGDSPVNLTADLDDSSESQPAWSSEGTFIAYLSDQGGDHEIWRMTATGTRRTQLTDNALLDLEPSWFPDDTRIAFRRNEPGGEAHIWMLQDGDGDGEFESETQITKGATSNIGPAVSPDGKRIAFASNRDGDYDIYVMRAAGEGRKNRPVKLTRNSVDDWNPDWSPNGAKIVFESERGGGDAEIAVIKANGRGLRYLTNNAVADIDPVWSPDAKRIAFERNGGGVLRDIVRMRADGTNQFNITDSGAIDANPTWQPR